MDKCQLKVCPLQEGIPVGCVPPAAVAVCLVWEGYASVHVGIHPPPGVALNLPPGCGPGDPPSVDRQTCVKT